MNVERLVEMANQIGRFHASLPDHAEALTGTATHVRRFWDPRMRRAIFAHLDQAAGVGLDPLVIEALTVHREMMEPK